MESRKTQQLVEEIRTIVGDILQLGARTEALSADSGLLGSIPEFDSMAVVTIVTAIEEYYGFVAADDELSGETFRTLGSLTSFVEQKLAQ